MYTLQTFTLDGTYKETGDPIVLRRLMARALEKFTGLGVPYHSIMLDPHGRVVATA